MILKYLGKWRAWRGVDRGFADRAFAYSVRRYSDNLHMEDSVQNLPDSDSEDHGTVMTTTSFQPKTIALRSRSQITSISPFSSIGVNGLPNGDVSQNASAVETGMPRPEGVLASGLAQPRDEGQNMQDEVSTVPLTD